MGISPKFDSFVGAFRSFAVSRSSRFFRSSFTLALIVAWVVALPAAASAESVEILAYVGPGAGLGMIGSLLAVLAAVIIGLFGLVLYPITLIRRMLRKSKESQAVADPTQTSAK